MKDITFVNGTCYKTKRPEEIYDAVFLPDYERVRSEKQIYAESFAVQYRNTDPFPEKGWRNRTERCMLCRIRLQSH